MEKQPMNADAPAFQDEKPIRMPASGFTLVELLVGVALALFLILGVVTVFTSTVRGSADNLRSARLNQELSATMQMMVNDIRRGGYSGYLPRPDDDNNDNPYFDMVTSDGDPADEVLREAAINLPSASCLLYSYDENSNGTLETTERRGFRLVNGVVQARTSGANPTNCNNNADTWQPLTDGDTVTVSALQFSTVNSKCKIVETQQNWTTTSAATLFPCSDASVTGYVAPATEQRTVETRQVNITLTGQAAADAGAQKTLTASVRVRNDWYLRHCTGTHKRFESEGC